MHFSLFADIQNAFTNFFTSLTSSVSYSLIFFIGIGLELFFIILFSVLSRFSYEGRMRRSLDQINRWLFKHKTLDKENIKEFSNLIKRAPNRLVINWQQYILYREKAPSEYMSVENIIEKPLRTSLFSSNIKNLSLISAVWALITFVVGISFYNVNDAIINGTMIVISLLVPIFIALFCTVAIIILRARKNANLDELYQNLHLFQRFIDNACLELPPYIDYSLLFTAQEIDKGIPALREYLESRARKEKEEFDKIAREDAISYEKYDFEGLGIDGQNILERAMKESEAYISKKDKTLAKIGQIEATLESLKKNFENIQKDFQKRMQVSKENIERLRQQQEATTNRIESNFLRKQQNQELAKQEKEEADFEQQQRRYISEKTEYEEVIKTLQEEIEGGRSEVEEAMMSEYETFYSKLFKSAIVEAEKKVKTSISSLKQTNAQIEEDLTFKEAQLKRVIDENETLKRKLGLDYQQIEIESAAHVAPKVEEKIEEPQEEVMLTPEDIARAVREKAEEVKTVAALKQEPEQEPAARAGAQMEEYRPALNERAFDFQPVSQNARVNQPAQVEEYQPREEVEFDDDFDFAQPVAVRQPQVKLQPETETIQPSPVADGAKRRGRPKKGEEKKLEEIVAEKKSRGRPRKVVEAEPEAAAPKKRGRPAGTTKVAPAVPGEKRGRGRPKKEISEKELSDINKKIDEESKRLSGLRRELDGEIKQAINDLETASAVQTRREELMSEINSLKAQVERVTSDNSADEIETINKKIEKLLSEIKNLND